MSINNKVADQARWHGQHDCGLGYRLGRNIAFRIGGIRVGRRRWRWANLPRRHRRSHLIIVSNSSGPLSPEFQRGWG